MDMYTRFDLATVSGLTPLDAPVKVDAAAVELLPTNDDDAYVAVSYRRIPGGKESVEVIRGVVRRVTFAGNTLWTVAQPDKRNNHDMALVRVNGIVKHFPNQYAAARYFDRLPAARIIAETVVHAVEMDAESVNERDTAAMTRAERRAKRQATIAAQHSAAAAATAPQPGSVTRTVSAANGAAAMTPGTLATVATVNGK